MSSREVKTFEALPDEVKIILKYQEQYSDAVIKIFNAGVRAGQSAGGDVRTINILDCMNVLKKRPKEVITCSAMVEILDSIRSDIIAALAKETK